MTDNPQPESGASTADDAPQVTGDQVTPAPQPGGHTSGQPVSAATPSPQPAAAEATEPAPAARRPVGPASSAPASSTQHTAAHTQAHAYAPQQAHAYAPQQHATYPPAVAYTQPPQPPAPKPRSGFGRGFGLGIGAALGAGLAFMLLQIPAMIAFFSLALAGSALGSEEADGTHVYGAVGASKTITSVPVVGPIMGKNSGEMGPFTIGTYGYDLAAKIDKIKADDTDGLLLEIDTPGGTIPGAKAIASAVDRYKERTGKPVTAYVRGMSASGGMYAMAGVDEIIVDHGTLVGSIGVIFGPITTYRGVTGLDGGLLGGGVTAESVESRYITAGKGKDFGNPFRESTPEELEHYQEQIDVEYTHFVDHVAKGRDIPAQKIRDDFGAYLFTADEAIDKGLADVKLGEEEAYSRVLEKSGGSKDDAAIVKLPGDSFWGSLLSASPLPLGSTPTSPYSAPVTPTEGNPRSKAAICTSGPVVLALHGDLSAACGE